MINTTIKHSLIKVKFGLLPKRKKYGMSSLVKNQRGEMPFMLTINHNILDTIYVICQQFGIQPFSNAYIQTKVEWEILA